MAQNDSVSELAILQTKYEFKLKEIELSISSQHLSIIQEAIADVLTGKIALEAGSTSDQRAEILHYTRHELVPQLEEQLRDRVTAATQTQIRRRISHMTRDHIQRLQKAKHVLRARQEQKRLEGEHAKQKAEFHRDFYEPEVLKLREELALEVAQLRAEPECERKVQLVTAEYEQKREVLLKNLAAELKRRASKKREAAKAQLAAEWQELQAQIDPMMDQKLAEVSQWLNEFQEELLRLAVDSLYDELDA